MAGYGLAIQAVANTASSLASASEARAAATTAFKRQRDLYKHRYQYTMADMREAGLNPILAYRQGPGSYPGVAQAQPHITAPTGLAEAYTSARKAGPAIAVLKAQRNQVRAVTSQQVQLAAQNASQSQKLIEEAKTIAAMRSALVNSARSRARLDRASVPLAEADARVFDSSAGDMMRWLKRGKELINPFSGSGGGPRAR